MPGIDERMLAQRIEEIKRAINGLGDSVAISVGVALFPDDGDATDTLLVEADSRMYADKQNNSRRRAEAKHQAATAMAIELSNVQDLDVTEAVTRMQSTISQLQANLQTSSVILNLSLMDFLR